MPDLQQPNQFALLKQRRFAPFFWTQFSGAANDNLFKFAFTVMVTYQISVAWLPPSLAGLVIGALFILPFLLFSATSGQLADKYNKATVMRFVKNLEILVMLVAAYGFVSQNITVLLFCTFLMGLHSTLFGPVKYAYLPEVLNEREITGGNGMVEMGTFVAILLGQMTGGLLVAMPVAGAGSVAMVCVVLACFGRMFAGAVPALAATDATLKINWNPVSETWRNLQLARQSPVVFRSLLGISWMWFFGAVFLSQFPSMAKEVLHGDARVASFLLVLFSIGIGIGALLCEKFSRHHIEIGLAPLGAIGMSVFSIDLFFALHHLPMAGSMGVAAFVSQPQHWRVMLDLVLLSLFTGLYSVPMYTLIQLRSPVTHRARIIAANNILNALFMIVSAVLAGAMLKGGYSIADVFLVTGVANLLVTLYVFLRVPEYLLRFVVWVLTRLVYRFQVQGDAHLPANGGAILVCNRTSCVDALLLMAASPRPISFLLDQDDFRPTVLGQLLKLAKAISMTPRAQDAAAHDAALDAAFAVLKAGDLLCIFSGGLGLQDAGLHDLEVGLAEILERTTQQGLAVSVVPMALTQPLHRRVFSHIGLNVGAPLHQRDGTDVIGQRVQELLV